MQLFGRKPRTARAASLKTVSRWQQFLEVLQDRNVQQRAGVTVLGILGFIVAVSAWGPAFTYRIGDRLERGVLSRTDFREVNRAETERLQRETEALVPYVFRKDTTPLNALPARLRNHLGAVVDARTVADLPADVRRAFGLEASSSDKEGSQAAARRSERERSGRFEDLKAALSGATAVGMELDQIQSDFDQFLQPLREYGVVNLEELTRAQIVGRSDDEFPVDRAIEITEEGGPPRPATLADVLLKQSIQDTGRLGTKWTSFPRLSAIRGALQEWLLHEIPPTLYYDAPATQEKRRIARETAGVRYDTYAVGSVLCPPGAIVDAEVFKNFTQNLLS